jgi:hypothetical protein
MHRPDAVAPQRHPRAERAPSAPKGGGRPATRLRTPPAQVRRAGKPVRPSHAPRYRLRGSMVHVSAPTSSEAPQPYHRKRPPWFHAGGRLSRSKENTTAMANHCQRKTKRGQDSNLQPLPQHTHPTTKPDVGQTGYIDFFWEGSRVGGRRKNSLCPIGRWGARARSAGRGGVVSWLGGATSDVPKWPVEASASVAFEQQTSLHGRYAAWQVCGIV